jgi:hypothetical protein
MVAADDSKKLRLTRNKPVGTVKVPPFTMKLAPLELTGPLEPTNAPLLKVSPPLNVVDPTDEACNVPPDIVTVELLNVEVAVDPLYVPEEIVKAPLKVVGPDATYVPPAIDAVLLIVTVFPFASSVPL